MTIIHLEHVTKEFRLGQIESLKTGIVNGVRSILGRPTEGRALFKALNDVSFSVDPGEVVGVIGHNGAGKSTLLKLLARITSPSSGVLEVKGRIAPLIEVGAGFVPELTGRENVYLNGSILGLSRKEIDRKFDEIVDFSEIEEFIDTPVKRYSSGMKVKLAFSVATSIEADILLIDEVLAVGDLAFQRKCFDRMEGLIKGKGKSVLLVSHNIRQIERLCRRVILLSRGEIIADGAPGATCRQFYQQSNERIHQSVVQLQASQATVSGSGEIEITSIELIGENGNSVEAIESGDALQVRLRMRVNDVVRKPEIIVGTHTTDFVYLTACSTALLPDRPDFVPGEYSVNCTVPSYPLSPGVYCIRVSIFDEYRRRIFSGETLKIFSVEPTVDEGLNAPLRLFDVDVHWECLRA